MNELQQQQQAGQPVTVQVADNRHPNYFVAVSSSRGTYADNFVTLDEIKAFCDRIGKKGDTVEIYRNKSKKGCGMMYGSDSLAKTLIIGE